MKRRKTKASKGAPAAPNESALVPRNRSENRNRTRPRCLSLIYRVWHGESFVLGHL
jgi:hypothetical protein